MNNAINETEVLKWFSGKPAEKARKALALLSESIAAGSWVPGVARSVRAALSKTNVAAKFASNYRTEMEHFGQESLSSYKRDPVVREAAFRLLHAMSYGYGHNIDMDVLAQAARNEYERYVVSTGIRYLSAMKPVWEAIEKLDATRPTPTFTKLGVSPTITATWQQLEAASVEVAPIEWTEIVAVDPKTGKKSYSRVGKILWPEATIHGAGRFSYSNSRQCESCGHAIKNPYNWVPLIVTTLSGSKKSLWVGRDCAASLFGIKMTGDLELT